MYTFSRERTIHGYIIEIIEIVTQGTTEETHNDRETHERHTLATALFGARYQRPRQHG